MKSDYATVLPDAAMEDDCRQLVRLAVREDLDRSLDWTTVSLVDAQRRGVCDVVSRTAGLCAGVTLLPWIVDEMDGDLSLDKQHSDGQPMSAGESLVRISGNARDLLTCERIILNILCRLCGVATLTGRYVRAISGTPAKLYDTRKTTPGWRRLEKYAVHCGGGNNHRTGLYDGFLIKDNHLALAGNGVPLSPEEATQKARLWANGKADMATAPGIVEIEVDSLEQLETVLPATPDIVLVDNFSVPQLRRAVVLRNQIAPQVELEASGGVTLDTIREIAETGVNRISCGAITHQAGWLDLGLDWRSNPAC